MELANAVLQPPTNRIREAGLQQAIAGVLFAQEGGHMLHLGNYVVVCLQRQAQLIQRIMNDVEHASYAARSGE
eukprot:2774299-Alexandrium_andersonii.AAC.1